MRLRVRILFSAIGVALCACLCQNAGAVPMVTGTIDMTGTAHFIPGPSHHLDTTPGVASITGSTVLDTSTGTFYPLSQAIDNLHVTIPVAWSGFTWSPVNLPTPLWDFAYAGVNYSFTLNTIAVVHHDITSIDLTGNGVLSVTGYAPTPGHWLFSSIANAGGYVFKFDSATQVIPDGGVTMSLLGMALLGVEHLRRKGANTR